MTTADGRREAGACRTRLATAWWPWALGGALAASLLLNVVQWRANVSAPATSTLAGPLIRHHEPPALAEGTASAGGAAAATVGRPVRQDARSAEDATGAGPAKSAGCAGPAGPAVDADPAAAAALTSAVAREFGSLGLTPEQLERIRDQCRSCGIERAAIDAELASASKALLDQLAAPEVDRGKLSALVGQLAALHGRSIEVGIEAVLRLRGELTPAQVRALAECCADGCGSESGE